MFEYKVNKMVIAEIMIIQIKFNLFHRKSLHKTENENPKRSMKNGSIELTNVLNMKSLSPKKFIRVSLRRQSYEINISEVFPTEEAFSFAEVTKSGHLKLKLIVIASI